MRKPISPELVESIRQQGIEAVAARVGVSHNTIRRAIKSGDATGKTLAALERIKDRVRTADEFKGSGAVAVRAPRRDFGIFSWDLEKIRMARDAQMLGHFSLPVALAKMMRTNHALYTAYHNRIAPQAAIAAELQPANGARGENVAKKACESVVISQETLAGIVGTRANHGIAIGYIEQEPNREGTRIDFKLTEWPLEHVRWNDSRRILETRVDNGAEMVPIVHGDGRWVVFKGFDVEPWTQDACVLPGGILWAMLVQAQQDWAGASHSHGNPRVIGEMPEGFALRSEDGLTPQAQEFIDMLQAIVSGQAGAGIRPPGSKTDVLFNGSTAWQVFERLGLTGDKAAQRIYLGTDAALGAGGGAPGVDIAALFGIASTKVQGDFKAIINGVNVGVYQPWAAVNFGDSRYAPRLKYNMPDPDEKRHVEDEDTRRKALLDTIERYKQLGMTVDQETVNALAVCYRVAPPVLKPAPMVSLPAVAPATQDVVDGAAPAAPAV